jgi:hypothetical protein
MVRMGAALASAGNEIRERLERGNRERGDGWFDASDGRPEAEELLEGVLLNAAVRVCAWLRASRARFLEVSGR